MEPVKKCYQLPFPIDVVYAAWVSPETVVSPATAMDIDPVVGGHYRLIIDGEGFSASNDGIFSRVEPGRRLTYSWEWNHDGKVTEIDVIFTADGGNTQVDLTHSGFTDADSQKMHDSGWDSYIDGLTRHIEAGRAG